MTMHHDEDPLSAKDGRSMVPAGLDLSKLSVRDLMSELTNVRDRLGHDPGYQMLPGQTRRRAVLLRRERQLTTELRRRGDEDSSKVLDEPLAT